MRKKSSPCWTEASSPHSLSKEQARDRHTVCLNKACSGVKYSSGEGDNSYHTCRLVSPIPAWFSCGNNLSVCSAYPKETVAHSDLKQTGLHTVHLWQQLCLNLG